MVEDYVTLIWKAVEWPGGMPSTTDLADQLGVTASTVSANLKKLARDGYIRYEPYGRIELTESGREIAVGVVRCHRILETYLVNQLGLTWDQVHDEADRLEHAVSDLVLERMDAVLGHPRKDPHGDPIPDSDGVTVRDDSLPLSDISPDTTVEVARISDRSPDVLRYLQKRGIVVGSQVRVVDVSQAASALQATVEGATVELSLHSAGSIRVIPR